MQVLSREIMGGRFLVVLELCLGACLWGLMEFGLWSVVVLDARFRSDSR